MTWCALLWMMTSLLAAVTCSSDDNMLFVDWSGQRMLSVSPGSCRINDDRGTVSWMIERAPYGMVRQIGSQELNFMVDACNTMYRPQSRPSLFIYPGTKWCGSGSLAGGFHDLGSLNAEDRCCRDHDLCPASLRAGQCRNGICNSSPFTRSHCECDVQFRRCLHEVGSAASHALGALYFNIVRSPCFSEQRSRVARNGFSSSANCDGPYPCDGQRYQYHRLAPYSLPFLSSPYSANSPTFTSIVPAKISTVLLTFFRFVGVV